MYSLTFNPEELKKQAEVRKKRYQDREAKDLIARIDSEVKKWWENDLCLFSINVQAEEFSQEARNAVVQDLKSQGYKVSQETKQDYRGDTSTVIVIEF